jgi:hypothetical protein
MKPISIPVGAILIGHVLNLVFASLAAQGFSQSIGLWSQNRVLINAEILLLTLQVSMMMYVMIQTRFGAYLDAILLMLNIPANGICEYLTYCLFTTVKRTPDPGLNEAYGELVMILWFNIGITMINVVTLLIIFTMGPIQQKEKKLDTCTNTA